MIEPSEEFGYRDLELFQQLRRDLLEVDFARKPNDLRLAYRLYRLRQTQSDSSQRKSDLDKVTQLIPEGSLIDARSELARLEASQMAMNCPDPLELMPHRDRHRNDARNS